MKASNSYSVSVNQQEEELFHQLASDQNLGSRVIDEKATILEKTKYQFCQAITRYQVQNNLSEQKIANLIKLWDNL